MEGSLFALAHKYVSFQLLKDVRVSNKYACRLYPALKSRADSQKKYKDIPILELTIDELRTLLVLGDTKYTKSYDLKRYVIEAAVDDINENSDIRGWPTYINKGRKLVGVRFNISASKYNYSQLALSLAEKDDKYLKYLKRTIKKKYSELDLKEFIAFYPDQFSIIEKAAKTEWGKYGDEFKEVPASVLSDWLDGTIWTYVKDFLKGEWEMSEKVG